MARKKRNDEEDGAESLGSDLEQMIAILEKAEIDYEKTEDADDGDEETILVISDDIYAHFDEEGNLLSMGAKF
jgi:hypothetical protein